MSLYERPGLHLCRFCGEPIYWMRYPKTNAVSAIDARPSDEGVLVLRHFEDTYRVTVPEERRLYLGDLHTFHHCLKRPGGTNEGKVPA